MLKTKFSPSVNIIRDSEKNLKYTPTPNAQKIAKQIFSDFNHGIHSFTLIGSYGTGKSSFLWAFEQTLKGNHDFFKTEQEHSQFKFIHWVGEYQSLINYSADQLHVENDLTGNQRVFDALYQQYDKLGKNGMLIIQIDEFGKFLEYATEHNPDQELYFIQQLAEFVNDPDQNIILLTTLHQNFESYGYILDESQRLEWRKVKGRFKELTFNEPVEQLIYLAAEQFDGKTGNEKLSKQLVKLIKTNHLFSINIEFINKVASKLYPLDPISAIVLTKALQHYGQNERSLFTFLQTFEHSEESYFHLAELCQYLHHNFYWYINSKYNPDFKQWSEIRSSIERAEALFPNRSIEATAIIQTIGLLQTFTGDAANINKELIITYGNSVLGIVDTDQILEKLERNKVVRYSKLKDSYKLFEGTDLDIEEALLNAGKNVGEQIDIAAKLRNHFDFPIITAKSISYTKGTPRLFEFVISEEPIHQKPIDQIDGFINLIFSESLQSKDIIEESKDEEEAILYGHFKNYEGIKNTLLDIERTKKVIEENAEDRVAKKELESILQSHEQLLSHYVVNALYSDKIDWYFKGKKETVKSKSSFNRLLSIKCDEVYPFCPEFNNELVNKHKISTSIHTARKNYFAQLVDHWNEPDFGFAQNKFPPEKTIYQSLLKKTDLHITKGDSAELVAPDQKSSFFEVWNACERFLGEAKEGRKKLTDLIEILSSRPYKLKQGLIDFWVPTYLFMKRGDYALYGDSGYIPDINDSLLYLITRNTKEYQIKAFEISGLRLKLFNKYRDFLQLKNQERLSNEGFIESIKPFLIFYRNLPEYTKHTERLSSEAVKFRDALVSAEDPEATFFEHIPKALKVDIKKLTDSDDYLSEYALALQEKVEELKNAYKNLLNRIEIYLAKDILGNDTIDFEVYKRQLQERFKHLKEHQLIQDEIIFLNRINSPLEDRDSWIASIAHALMKKQLESITDKDELILKDRMQFMIRALDNQVKLDKEEDKESEELLKLDITAKNQGLKEHTVRIQQKKIKEKEKTINSIKDLLNEDKSSKIAILTKLLKEELDNE